jgi:hypothetical protein
VAGPHVFHVSVPGLIPGSIVARSHFQAVHL